MVLFRYQEQSAAVMFSILPSILFLRIKAKIIDPTEASEAVKNMSVNDTPDGTYIIFPCKSMSIWFVCIYIPATAGPIDAPIILIRLLIPSEIPVNFFGVDKITTFMAPTLVNDKPVDKIARLIETSSSVE